MNNKQNKQNKQIVRDFFDYFFSANVSAAESILDGNVVWTMMGCEGGAPMQSEMDKEGILGLINIVTEIFPEGIRFIDVGWTIDGERVAYEAESYGVKVNGTVYNNLYHFLLRIVDGKIVEVKEYLDTLHVKSVFVNDV